jgi:nitrogen regulatory protein P-II 1
VRLITAIIRPGLLDTVHRALAAFGVSGLTVTEVFADSRWNRHLEVYRSAIMVATSVARVRIEVLVDDADCADLTDLLLRVCETGRGGDDTLAIWISDVEQVVRVRTGEHS